jgi:hypothetical protein
MRKSKLDTRINLDTVINEVQSRLLDCAMKADYEIAKKELDLLLGILKLNSIKPIEPPPTIAQRRKERDKLMAQLTNRLERIREKHLMQTQVEEK